jgi:hypothetical protein
LTIKKEGDFGHLHDILLQRSSLRALDQLHLHFGAVTFGSDKVHLLYPRIRKLAFGQRIGLSISLWADVGTKEMLEPMLEATRCLAGELRTLDLVFYCDVDLNPLYICLKETRLPRCARLAIGSGFYKHYPASFFTQYVQNLVAPDLRIIDIAVGLVDCDFLEAIEQQLRQHA